jgi:hypothetical protein
MAIKMLKIKTVLMELNQKYGRSAVIAAYSKPAQFNHHDPMQSLQNVIAYIKIAFT